ncbi:MAG: MarR family transcriptional regulator [bacterium]
MPRTTRSASAQRSSATLAVAASVDAIRRILRALRLAARQTQTVAGLSAAQLFVLQALDDGEEASLSDLAVRTMTDRSSVAAVVDRLLEVRLVVRGTASTDRRRAAIALTAAGRDVLARSPEPPTALLVKALRTLPDLQLAPLAEGLTLLAAAMGLAEEPAGMLFDDERARRDRSKTGRTGRGR